MQTSHTTLPALLRSRAAEMPDKRYLIDIEDRAITYRGIVDLMDTWAAAYKRIGIGAGDIVVTMQTNTIESLAGWLGLCGLGATEAPINNDYRGDLLAHALNLTRATTFVVLEQFVDRLAEIADRLPHLRQIIVVDGRDRIYGLPFDALTGRDFLDGASPLPEMRDPAPWQIGAILFTSGTTGPSKAVRMPWAQIHSTAVGTLPLKDFGPDDVIFNPGPTYHVGAKVFPFIAALIGASHVMRPFISLQRMPEEYRKYGVTTAFYPPFVWLDEPPRPADKDVPLRNLLMPVRLPRIEEFKARFGCRTFAAYSMTEMSCPIVDPDWDSGRVSAEGFVSCGKQRAGYPGYEMRIVDENDQEVPPGVVGELIVRSAAPWTMNAGYLNNPEATAAAWRNGWFHTGDAFHRDADGYFYFRDRIKDCIRRRMENISSFEVESYVKKHPAVLDCAAVAVKMQDGQGADEEIRLVVVCKSGANVDAAELVRWLIPQMPRFMIPRFVEFMTALPQTPTLKVQKVQLRNRPITGVWDREAAGIELPR
jgi:carnitine-CoA ligase